MKHVIKSILLVLLSTIYYQAMALDAGDLKFVAGDDPGNYGRKGRPKATYNIKNTLPVIILKKIYSMLPDSIEVAKVFNLNNKEAFYEMSF